MSEGVTFCKGDFFLCYDLRPPRIAMEMSDPSLDLL